MRIGILLFFLLFLLGCAEEKIEYEVQFNLDSFTKQQYDLYNPLLNSLKLDSTARENHPGYYDYDAYYDEKGTLRFLFYRSGSYGYLQKLFYSDDSQLSNTFIYPILAGSVHERASSIYNDYYYINGRLVALRDELDDAVLIIDGDSVTVYKGILRSRGSLKFKKMAISDYYIRYLSSLPTGLDSTSSVE